ncbi:hypothetical protein FXO38_02318 [Capsicum annuum]|nr:hypothetical protein FXO38_02318 [Capsicum annuum]
MATGFLVSLGVALKETGNSVLNHNFHQANRAVDCLCKICPNLPGNQVQFLSNPPSTVLSLMKDDSLHVSHNKLIFTSSCNKLASLGNPYVLSSSQFESTLLPMNSTMSMSAATV